MPSGELMTGGTSAASRREDLGMPLGLMFDVRQIDPCFESESILQNAARFKRPECTSARTVPFQNIRRYGVYFMLKGKVRRVIWVAFDFPSIRARKWFVYCNH